MSRKIRLLKSVRVVPTRSKGFTLVELVVVMLIVGLLGSLAAPVITQSLLKGKEAVLRQNLLITRKAIDDYFADHGYYPESISQLVEEKYLRSMPYDPFVQQSDQWVEIDTQRESISGVEDLRSSSNETAVDGSSYSDW